MGLFKKRYRIESARLRGFDYASPGTYFVTIDTKWMIHWFGDVVDGEMKLSGIGEIVAEEWMKTPTIRSNVSLDEWQVMPNHLHGIIVIWESGSDRSSGQLPFVDWDKSMVVETTRRVVSTTATTKTLKPNSLGSIMGQIKSQCTKRIHDAGYIDFQWQSRFHDHIIRDEAELDRIRQYIRDNPKRWSEDKENPRKESIL